MYPIALRPRKATEIVDAAIEVYRRNPIHFLLLTSIVHVPALILQIIFVGNGTQVSEVIASAIIGFGTLLTYFLMSALIIQMASELYLGRDTDAWDSFRQVWRRLPTIFVAWLICSMIFGIGLVLFLFPAVFFSALLFAVIPAIVIEKRGLGAAFERSAFLSNGLKWHILSALGLVVLIRFAVTIGAVILFQLIPLMPLRLAATSLVAIILTPVVGISEALIYYDARIRREGFDIEMMAPGAGSVTATQA